MARQGAAVSQQGGTWLDKEHQSLNKEEHGYTRSISLSTRRNMARQGASVSQQGGTWLDKEHQSLNKEEHG